MPKLSIVMPCYNVEKNVPVTMDAVYKAEKLYPDDVSFEYVLIDDGSTDQTLQAIEDVQKKDPERTKVIKLARNFGANNATLCGLNHAEGDCFAPLAADLQDPPELLAEMYQHWLKGTKLVVANRKAREEWIGRRFFSAIYHFFMRFSMPQKVPKGGFDLFLFDKQIQKILVQLDERNAYWPYLLMWFGFDFVSIPYTRRKREIGKSMWSLSKKVKAAVDSMVAFSFFPIRLISVMGFVLGFAAFLYLANILVQKWVLGNATAVEGWSSLMAVLLVVSCFQMMAIGVIGEYLWRTLDATRGRPNFIVDKFLPNKKSQDNGNIKKLGS